MLIIIVYKSIAAAPQRPTRHLIVRLTLYIARNRAHTLKVYLTGHSVPHGKHNAAHAVFVLGQNTYR